MEFYYASDCDGRFCRLDPEESGHCVRVLRHRAGDEIAVVDGRGTLYRCRLTDDAPKAAVAEVLEAFPDRDVRPYSLNMAVCPTKNNERFEWFAEKATELGVDVISPVFGDHSERRVFKTDRTRKIVLSAMKQSLKATLPVIEEPVSVRDFILTHGFPGTSAGPVESGTPSADGVLRLIAWCFEGEVPRQSIVEVLRAAVATGGHGESLPDLQQIIVLIGPEGDFSPEEGRLAVSQGFIPVHLGASRLRTETAALTAVAACYLAAQGWNQSATLV